MLIHKIKNPHLVFLTIFNGAYFSFKNLIVSVKRKKRKLKPINEANKSPVEPNKKNEPPVKIKEECDNNTIIEIN